MKKVVKLSQISDFNPIPRKNPDPGDKCPEIKKNPEPRGLKSRELKNPESRDKNSETQKIF